MTAKSDAAAVAPFASRAPRASMAMVVVTATLVLVLVGIGLDLRGRGAGMFADVAWFVGVVGALGYAVPGAQVWHRQPHNIVGRLSLAIGFVYALSYTSQAYGTYGLETAPGSLPAAPLAEWLALWVWAVGYCMIPTVFLLLVPDGRLLSSRWRPVLWSAEAGVVLAALGWAVSPYDERDAAVTTELTNPVGASWGPAVLNAAVPLLLVSALAGLISVVVRYRRATGTERDQAAWVLLGALGTAALLGLGVLLPYGGVGQYVSAAALLPLPVSLGVAVLRHGLWDIDTLLHRAVVHGSLIVVLIGLHIAVVAGVSVVARGSSGTGVLAAAIVAAAAVPLYARLRSAADRLVYGDREEPWALVATLADRIRAAPSVPDLVADIATTLTEGLRLGRVTIDLDSEIANDAGGEAQFEVPLVRAGRRMGNLFAVGRAGARVGATERIVLGDLAPHIAAAIEASSLADALHASRNAIVRAREEERRWLRHELHDGVGPTLAAVALELETTRDLTSANSHLDAQIDRLAARLNDVVADVRRVVDGLRPAVLDDLGLVAALEAQVARLGSRTFPVSLYVEGRVPTLPAAVDLAVFRVVSEAVTNAARHSRGTVCQVVIAASADEIHVEVRDDGAGFGEAALPGLGLVSMRQRADELGGTCDVRTGPGGTTVDVRLPFTRRQR